MPKGSTEIKTQHVNQLTPRRNKYNQKKSKGPK